MGTVLPVSLVLNVGSGWHDETGRRRMWSRIFQDSSGADRSIAMLPNAYAKLWLGKGYADKVR